jgi:hypothetical protein
MQQPSRRALGLAWISLLGFVLFNYPLLALADRAPAAFGAPALLVYLFAVWAVLIGLTVLLRR